MDRKITRREACSYFGTVAVGYCEAQEFAFKLQNLLDEAKAAGVEIVDYRGDLIKFATCEATGERWNGEKYERVTLE